MFSIVNCCLHEVANLKNLCLTSDCLKLFKILDVPINTLSLPMKALLINEHLFVSISHMYLILHIVMSFQVSPGEHVIDQGDDGDNFYVIDR